MALDVVALALALLLWFVPRDQAIYYASGALRALRSRAGDTAGRLWAEVEGRLPGVVSALLSVLVRARVLLLVGVVVAELVVGDAFMRAVGYATLAALAAWLAFYDWALDAFRRDVRHMSRHVDDVARVADELAAAAEGPSSRLRDLARQLRDASHAARRSFRAAEGQLERRDRQDSSQD
jgi:hypothetical protein